MHRPALPPLQLCLAALALLVAACEPNVTSAPTADGTTAAYDRVKNQAPIARVGGPYTGVAGVPVQFDGTASSDPDGNLPLTYAWNFGDGTTGTGATPTHTYAAPGTYTVTLKVKDSRKGASKPSSTTATIAANQAPVASPGGPYSGESGTPVAFSGSGTDPDNNLPLTFAWNFGDGSTGTGETPTHTYGARGTYTVSLVVTDALGKPSAPATTSAQITGNGAPVADAGGPYSARPGIPVQFDGSASSDPDGDALTTYAWDFGDGSTGSGAAPTHAYAAGSYVVTLVVTDAYGAASAPDSTTVTVASALVVDSFSRTLSSGWGSPEVGGDSWFIDAGFIADFRVDGSHGLLLAPDNRPRNVISEGLQGYGLDVRGIASFSINQFPDPGAFFTVQTYCRRDDRVTDGDNYYRMRVRAFGPSDANPTTGKLDVRLEKEVATVQSFITGANYTLPIRWSPGQKIWMRWECFGTSPSTVVRMRVWFDGTTEPTTWDQEVTVNEPALDVIGTTGFRVEGPNSNTAGSVVWPVTFTFDDLLYELR